MTYRKTVEEWMNHFADSLLREGAMYQRPIAKYLLTRQIERHITTEVEAATNKLLDEIAALVADLGHELEREQMLSEHLAAEKKRADLAEMSLSNERAAAEIRRMRTCLLAMRPIVAELVDATMNEGIGPDGNTALSLIDAALIGSDPSDPAPSPSPEPSSPLRSEGAKREEALEVLREWDQWLCALGIFLTHSDEKSDPWMAIERIVHVHATTVRSTPHVLEQARTGPRLMDQEVWTRRLVLGRLLQLPLSQDIEKLTKQVSEEVAAYGGSFQALKAEYHDIKQ